MWYRGEGDGGPPTLPHSSGYPARSNVFGTAGKTEPCSTTMNLAATTSGTDVFPPLAGRTAKISKGQRGLCTYDSAHT